MTTGAVSVGALRAIKAQDDVLELLGDLGYAATKAAPPDHEQLGLVGQATASGFRSDRGSRKGHGVLIGETEEIPCSFRGRQVGRRPLLWRFENTDRPTA
jgi:hypothetical protein